MRALTFFLAACMCPVAASAAVPAPYVAPVLQVVSAARLQAISDTWAKKLVKDRFHQVILAYPIGDQSVNAGHIDIGISKYVNISSGYASVPLEIRLDGTLVRTVYCGYRIVTLLSQPVLNSNKHRGDILSSGDFHMANVPDDGRPAVEVANLVGRVLNSDQHLGAVVRPEETTMNLIVKAGSPVVLVVHDGGVALSADVVARTSGGLGENVTVYDENARRMLSGIVTAPSRVELILPEVTN